MMLVLVQCNLRFACIHVQVIARTVKLTEYSKHVLPLAFEQTWITGFISFVSPAFKSNVFIVFPNVAAWTLLKMVPKHCVVMILCAIFRIIVVCTTGISKVVSSAILSLCSPTLMHVCVVVCGPTDSDRVLTAILMKSCCLLFRCGTSSRFKGFIPSHAQHINRWPCTTRNAS